MYALTVTVRPTGYDCYNDWCLPELPLKRGETHINDHGHLDITTLNNIPEGAPYVVYLNVYHDMFALMREDLFVPIYDWFQFKGHFETHNLRKKTFMMPDRISSDSACGLVTWIIEWNSESDTVNHIFFDKMLEGLNVKDGSQVIFLTAAETRWGMSPEIKTTITDRYGIRVYTSNRLHEFCTVYDEDTKLPRPEYTAFINTQIEDTLHGTPRPYKAVCYNRQPRRHRLRVLAHMRYHGYLDRTIYSLGGEPGRPGPFMPDYYPSDDGFEYMREHIEWFKHCEPINTQFGETVNLGDNQASTICYPHAANSYFHIVTETASYVHTYITEKSYKPFMYMQPFIQFGNVHNVQVLRNMGYNVFDKHIDHTYDTEQDEEKRMRLFFMELDRLFALSDDDFIKMRKDIIEGLKHNAWLVAQPQEQNPLWFMGP